MLWRGYVLGFDKDNSVAIYKNDFGLKLLKKVDFNWELGEKYDCTASVDGNKISFIVDGMKIISTIDDSYKYGMYGCGGEGIGRTFFGNFYYEGNWFL